MKKVRVEYTQFNGSFQYSLDDGRIVYVEDTPDDIVYGRLKNLTVVVKKGVSGSVVKWNTKVGTYQNTQGPQVNLPSSAVIGALYSPLDSTIMELPGGAMVRDNKYVSDFAYTPDTSVSISGSAAFGRYYGEYNYFNAIISLENDVDFYKGNYGNNPNVNSMFSNVVDDNLFVATADVSQETFQIIRHSLVGATADIIKIIPVPYRDTVDGPEHILKNMFSNKDYLVLGIGAAELDGHIHIVSYKNASLNEERVFELDYGGVLSDYMVDECIFNGILDDGSPVLQVRYSHSEGLPDIERFYVINMIAGSFTFFDAGSSEGLVPDGGNSGSSVGLLSGNGIYAVSYHNYQDDPDLRLFLGYSRTGEFLGSIVASAYSESITTSDGICVKNGEIATVYQGVTPLRDVTLSSYTSMVAIVGTGHIVHTSLSVAS